LTLASVAVVTGVDGVIKLLASGLESVAAALTAVAPLEATSLPPPQETRAKDARDNSSNSSLRFIEYLSSLGKAKI
jgi:hypothetical protein